MVLHEMQVNECEVCQTDGKLLVRVPWCRADNYQNYFRSQGIGSTLHLDPRAHEAYLEPWTNLSAERLTALLNEGTLQLGRQRARV